MNFIKKNAYLLIALVASSVIISCNAKPPSKEVHTVTTGRVSMIVDESFLPIIEDELAVFESTYEDAVITLISKPEQVAVYSLLSDSAKVAILARELNEEEIKFFESKNIIPKATRFATDGIAIIANKANLDTLIAVDDILNVLRGNASTVKSLVFDNPNSSTVRFLKDLADVEDLPKEGIYALNSNEEVIKYVYDNPQSIGVVGINWIVQPSPQGEEYAKGVRVLSVKGADDEYYTPSQSNLALGKYPLARDLFLINCQGVRGLGLGFSAFLAGERGQRIILKSGLLPDSIPAREVNIIKLK